MSRDRDMHHKDAIMGCMTTSYILYNVLTCSKVFLSDFAMSRPGFGKITDVSVKTFEFLG